jgi:hypothetical protein
MLAIRMARRPGTDPIAFFGPVIAFYDANAADLKDRPAQGHDYDADGKKTDPDSPA